MFLPLLRNDNHCSRHNANYCGLVCRHCLEEKIALGGKDSVEELFELMQARFALLENRMRELLLGAGAIVIFLLIVGLGRVFLAGVGVGLTVAALGYYKHFKDVTSPLIRS